MHDYTVTSAILCEFCRSELGGKTTLIGVLSGDIVVEQFPASFPVAAYLEVRNIPEGLHSVRFRITTGEQSMDLEAQVEVRGEYGAFPLPTTPIELKDQAQLQVQFSLDQEDWVTVISRRVVTLETLGSIN